MTQRPSSANPETAFTRGAWLTLGLALLMVVAGHGILAYRFSLPTDGWKVVTVAGGDTYLYLENVMGGASGLQPDDRVVAVGGVSTTDWPALARLAPAWQVGATLPYTVERAGQAGQVDVTLGRWRFSLWLLATLRRPGEVAALLPGYLVLGIAALVFWRRPANPAAGAFLLLNGALGLVGTVTGTLTNSWPDRIDPVASRLTGPVAQSLLFGVVLPAALLRFALVFPRPKAVLLRRPWLGHLPLAASLLVFWVGEPGNSVSWFWFVGSLFGMLIILGHNAVEMRDAVSRAQVLWGLGGLLFGFGVLAVTLLGGTLGLPWLTQTHFDLAAALAMTAIGGTLAIAITRYRLFDIDVIIRRTLVYSVLTVLLALAYFGSVVVLGSAFRTLTGLEQNQLSIVVSTVTIFALFGPLRARVQQAIDRRFYRRKYDAALTLAAFGASLRDEVDLHDLTVRLAAVVDDTMQPATTALWLRPASRPSPAPMSDVS